MICLVLAGGKGNSLWPLSRENYPKQFMEVKANRSLFQETIARNIPFCDEFLIVTNESYLFIVEGQMKAFQGLKYRCLLEAEGRKTGPAITLACLCCNPSDVLYVVSADQIIEGENYKETLMEGQRLAKEGTLVTFGMKALFPHTGYGYICHEGQRVCSFHEKPDEATARAYIDQGNYLWNSGNFMFPVRTFLGELNRYRPELEQACQGVLKKVNRQQAHTVISAQLMQQLPAISVEKAVFEQSQKVKVVAAGFYWWDMGDMGTLAEYLNQKGAQQIIKEGCENVTVINQTKHQLVVANHLKDIVIVNTKDVTYVTSAKAKGAIKQIMNDHRKDFGDFFEEGARIYRPWGNYEVLVHADHYMVKQVVVYPQSGQTLHTHESRSEQWSIIEGVAEITMDNKKKCYEIHETVLCPPGVDHRIYNPGEVPLVLVETTIGQDVKESDKRHIKMADNASEDTVHMVKCLPAFKDYLWGGTKLRTVYGKACDYDVIAESWELSAHPDGQCTIAEGPYKGMLFGNYLQKIGTDGLGWKCQAFERFPLLIKFIDARKALSVQVHPGDDYALPVENEYGKNEMWYVMECEPDAEIYYGIKQPISKEELKQRIEDETVTEVLNRVKVKKGDAFFVESGTIHAIGAGILICEIQQNSNCTYRMYDYGRRDSEGRLRPLHLDKALEVVNTQPPTVHAGLAPLNVDEDGNTVQEICNCKYFVSTKYEICDKMTLKMDSTSFVSIMIIEGTGTIDCSGQTMTFKAADSFFVRAGEKILTIRGKATILATHV